MKTLFVITIISFCLPSFGSDSEIFLFKEESLEYQIKLSDIMPGYSARSVRDGFLLGTVKATAVDIMDKEIKEVFDESMRNDQVNSKALENSEKELATTFGSIPGSATVAAPSPPLIAKEGHVIWKNFEECAKTFLPSLKRGIYLKAKLSDDDGAKEHYELYRSSTFALSGSQNFVCDQHLAPSHELSVNGEVANLKLLSALLSRESDQRHLLFETALAAFSKHAPEESRMLFVYIWAKLSFLAITSSESLPNYDHLVRELETEKRKSEISIARGDTKVTHEFEVSYTNLRETLALGQKFISESGVRYE